MKRLLIFLLLLLPALALMSQDQIRLKNGTQIDDVRIHQLLDHKVVYEEAGSLHEVLRADVKWVRQAGNSPQSLDPASWHTDSALADQQNPLQAYDKRLVVPEQGALYVVPSAMANITPAVVGGIELALSPRWSALQEGGVILFSGQDDFQPTDQGWTSRTQLRHYLKEPFRFFHRPGRVFISGEFVYKSLDVSYDWENQNPYADPSEVHVHGLREDIHRETIGGNALLGVQWVWPNGLLLEVWGGAGVGQQKSYRQSEYYEYVLVDGEQQNYDGGTEEWTYVEHWPSIAGGFKIGVAF